MGIGVEDLVIFSPIEENPLLSMRLWPPLMGPGVIGVFLIQYAGDYIKSIEIGEIIK
jgi:hypothetical protein